MSHEFRTSLNAIIGLKNIALQEKEISLKTRSYYEKIGNSAKHLLELVNDVLDMSCIESGRLVLKEETFLFQDVIDQVNVMIHGQCEEKGKIALEMFVQNVPNYYDIILMDIRMPVMDGWDTTLAIRNVSREDAATIPIIAVTANALQKDVQKSLQVGMNAHFSKPIEVEMLYEILENFL